MKIFGLDVKLFENVNVPKKPDPFAQIVPYGIDFKVKPIVSHPILYSYYITDPLVQSSTNTFKDQILRGGYYLTGKNEDTVKLVKDELKRMQFKEKFGLFVKDGLINGNGMFEKIGAVNKIGTPVEGKLMNVDLMDMRIVDNVIRDPKDPNKIKYIVQNDNKPEIKRMVPYENIIHWRLFGYSKNALGIGLYHSLAVPQYSQDGEAISLLDDMKKLRESFPRIIKKFASPKEIYIFPNENEPFVKQKGIDIKAMKDGESMFTNKDFIHKEFTIDPRSRHERYIDMIQLWYEIGVQSPVAKMLTTPGFTEASAKEVRELVEERVRSIQDDLRGIVEEQIINQILLTHEKNPEEEEIVFHFGQPDLPDFDIAQVLQSAFTRTPNGQPLVTWEEAREMLRQSGWNLKADKDINLEPTNNPQLQEGDSLKPIIIRHKGRDFEIIPKKKEFGV